MAADFSSGLSKSALILGGVIPIGFAILMGLRGLIGFAISLLGVLLLLRFVRTRIGGVTGDVFGSIVEVVETITLITLTA